MYNYETRIRYSECDGEEVLTLPGIINYFQDAAIFNSEDVGFGGSALKKDDCAWVVCSWQVEVVRYPKFGERIRMITYPYEFKRCIGGRNCHMTTLDGESLIKGNCTWTYMNMVEQRPQKIPEGVMDAYEFGEKLDMNYQSRKIFIPEGEGIKFSPVIIEKQHIDSLGHVNNGQYIRIALEYKSNTERTMNFRAEYRSQAHLGDIIIPERYELSDKEIIALKNPEGVVFASVEIGM